MVLPAVNVFSNFDPCGTPCRYDTPTYQLSKEDAQCWGMYKY
jgi:hypothetical protein